MKKVFHLCIDCYLNGWCIRQEERKEEFITECEWYLDHVAARIAKGLDSKVIDWIKGRE